MGPTCANTREVEVAPIASSQVGMVWHEQFAPGSFSLAPLVRRYHGPLDVAALEAALAALRHRHDSCRCTFALGDGEPSLVFSREEAPLVVHDLSELGGDGARDELWRILRQAGSAPYDLVAGPLWEPRLVRMSAEDHVLVIRVHHAVFDDWSVGPFRRELSVLYSAAVSGALMPDGAPSGSFADFSRRQRARIEGPAGEREWAFWRKELASAPLSTQLPIGDPARPVGSPHGAAGPIRFPLGADLSAAIAALARQERVTVFVVLLTVFAALLERYCGQDDLVISTLVAGRNRSDLHGVIGCFGKKIVVRVDLSGAPNFCDALARVRHALTEALAYQDLAYEAVVQDGLGARAARLGLVAQVSVKFQAEAVTTDRLTLTGLTTSAVAPPPGAGSGTHFLAQRQRGDEPPGSAALPWGGGLYLKTFLGLSVSESGDGLELVAEGVFHRQVVEQLVDHFRELADAAVADPAAPLAGMALRTQLSAVDGDSAAGEALLELAERAAGWPDKGGAGDADDATSAEQAVAAIGDGTLDVLACSPGRLGQLLDAGLEQALATRASNGTAPEPATVLLVLDGPLDPVLWAQWRRIGQGDGRRLVHLWASDQWPGVVTLGEARSAPARPVAGRPVTGTSVRVLDRLGRTVPLGAQGELYLAAGPDSPASPSGWLARILPGGDVELIARTDRLTSLGGYLVDLSRIEAVLVCHPSVATVKVEAGKGDGVDQSLVATVEVKPGLRAPSLEELRTWLWAALPGYAWPTELVVIGVPITAPDPPPSDRAGFPTLAQLWASAQGVEAVRPDANYWQSFSFLAALSAARAHGVEPPTDAVLRNRTLETLAIDLAADALRRQNASMRH